MAKLAAVWNKAFASGSKSLQDRLKKVHASNPEFQSWLKSSGHGAGESVKQASKEVKSTARVKSLQQKSLKAYGATKGTRMGSEDGSGEAIRDTIAPLTRDQHAKVQAAEREAKAAAKKSAPAAPKKPLSTSQRLSAIAAAVRKAKAKHDVPTMEPDDEGHDDLRDVHQSLHIRSGYNEEVEQVDEGKVAKALAVGAMTLASMGAKAHTDTTKSVAQLARERPALAQRLKDIGAEGQVPASDVRAAELQKKQDQEMPASERRAKELEKMKKEEFEQIDEVTKKEAESALGGPVKEIPKMPPGIQKPGYRYVRNLARKAMKAGLKKEEVEQINEGPSHFLYTGEVNGKPYEYTVRAHSDLTDDAVHKALKRDNDHLEPHEIKAIVDSGGEEESHVEVDHKGKKYTHHVINNQEPDHLYEEVEQISEQDDTMEKVEMAQGQLHFICYAAEEIIEFIKKGGEVEEWYQNKLSKVHSDMESLHSYVEGEMRRTGMKEEVEQIDELKKSTLKSYVKKASAEAKKAYDYHQMRYGGREGSNPEYMKKTYPAMVAKFDRREAGVEKAKQKLAKEEVEQVDEKAPPGAKYERMVKHIKAGYAKGGLTDKEKSIAYATAWKAYKKNEEAEGTVAVTPKEKALAAHHGDKTKITYGDVVKARIKSAAAKAMKNK